MAIDQPTETAYPTEQSAASEGPIAESTERQDEQLVTPHDALKAYLGRRDELLGGVSETGLAMMERTPETIFFVGYNGDASVDVTFFGSLKQTRYHLFGANGVHKFEKHAEQDWCEVRVGELEPRMLSEMITGSEARTVMPWLSA